MYPIKILPRERRLITAYQDLDDNYNIKPNI